MPGTGSSASQECGREVEGEVRLQHAAFFIVTLRHRHQLVAEWFKASDSHPGIADSMAKLVKIVIIAQTKFSTYNDDSKIN